MATWRYDICKMAIFDGIQFYYYIIISGYLDGHNSNQTHLHAVPFFQLEVLHSTSSWYTLMPVAFIVVKI